MTHNAFCQSPQEGLTRREALPICLTDGRPLQGFLARDTSLGPGGPEEASRGYCRFLALALASPGQPRMPGPMIAPLWQLQREDSAAWAAF
ncbi:MAG: hypothetical protein JNN06_17130 [Gemmobacter sp.]|uniref:hypothetical protein n=1 Tax=Gemmobacter sp. TaxID=1898957 RepID=UPI001A526AA7|nr:hypothetical protein [Gemmobacter sp.]MBL8563993.1 hypothetical protein [Gemmobacter sp.]